VFAEVWPDEDQNVDGLLSIAFEASIDGNASDEAAIFKAYSV
jgi:hypothetical protein